MSWLISIILVSHIIGTLTFFFTSLAHMWVFEQRNRYSLSVKDVLFIFYVSNLWLKVWHSGMYGFLFTPDMGTNEKDE